MQTGAKTGPVVICTKLSSPTLYLRLVSDTMNLPKKTSFMNLAKKTFFDVRGHLICRSIFEHLKETLHIIAFISGQGPLSSLS